MSASQDEVEGACRELGREIAMVCPPGVGFALLTFSIGPGFTAYCANVRRDDVIRELRETADRLERQGAGADRGLDSNTERR